MPVVVSNFSSDTQLHDGHYGLITTEGAGVHSTITIYGSNFRNGLKVTIVDPKTGYVWTGVTEQSNGDGNGTRCVAQVHRVHKPKFYDDAATVSITVDDSTPPKPVDTYTGPA
ncbi:MAG TPA: hypothetical protein VH120_12650 [Gemmataceae bacterium]|nr:hypothetical protein [Gemmataceae bacterium]